MMYGEGKGSQLGSGKGNGKSGEGGKGQSGPGKGFGKFGEGGKDQAWNGKGGKDQAWYGKGGKDQSWHGKGGMRGPRTPVSGQGSSSGPSHGMIGGAPYPSSGLYHGYIDGHTIGRSDGGFGP